MNVYFFSASSLAFLVGLMHSVLGERRIFRRQRANGRLLPIDGGQLLEEEHVRIVWASWHALTIFDWGFAFVLLWLALQPSGAGSTDFIEHAIAFSMLAGSGVVFVGTKGRHPGWVGLLGVAVLVWLGSAG